MAKSVLAAAPQNKFELLDCLSRLPLGIPEEIPWNKKKTKLLEEKVDEVVGHAMRIMGRYLDLPAGDNSREYYGPDVIRLRQAHAEYQKNKNNTTLVKVAEALSCMAASIRWD
ncbi:MAG: hypothetical protein HYT16_02555 [DPANN group archaeon]|nr:hypothetical protein [DPANN group archaeon]